LLALSAVFYAGCGLHYGRTPANSVPRTSQAEAATAAANDNDLKETFSIDRFGVSLILQPSTPSQTYIPGNLELRAEGISTSNLDGLNASFAYYYPIPIASNKFSVCPGIELGYGMIGQELVTPYRGKEKVNAFGVYRRGFIGLELGKPISFGIEVGWSKFKVMNKWDILEGEGENITSYPVPDELLHYSQVEIGGYDFTLFLRVLFED